MLLKIVFLSVTASLLFVVLKKYSPEMTVFFEVAVSACVLGLLLLKLGSLTASLEKLVKLSDGTKELFSLLLKGAVICILSRIASDLCLDSGNKLIAALVETGARFTLVLLSLPLVSETFGIVFAFLP